MKNGTDLNPADLLTKLLPNKRIRELCILVGVESGQSSTKDVLESRVCSEEACSM